MFIKYPIFLLVLLLVFTPALAGSKKTCSQHPPYTQSALTLSWPGQFCSQAGMCTSEYQKWSGHTFGIHGYWPSYDSADLSCVMNGPKPDPYCDYKYAFNEDALADIKDLDLVWPQYGVKNQKTFHKNQWTKHGVCYLLLNKQKFKGKYSDAQLFHRYFADSVTKAKLNYRVSKFSFSSKADLAANLKIKNKDNFYVYCKGDHIVEIRICYDLGTPGAQKQIKCFDRDLKSESKCKYPLILQQKEDETED